MISCDLQDFDVKDSPSRKACCTISVVWRASQLGNFSNGHSQASLIPARNNLKREFITRKSNINQFDNSVTTASTLDLAKSNLEFERLLPRVFSGPKFCPIAKTTGAMYSNFLAFLDNWSPRRSWFGYLLINTLREHKTSKAILMSIQKLNKTSKVVA